MKKYTSVGDFREGFCKVEFEGKWGFIDLRGIEVIPCIYDSVMDFEDGIASVEADDDYFDITFNNERIETVPESPTLDLIYSKDFFNLNPERRFENIESVLSNYDNIIGYDTGLCEVVKDEKYGFIDINGNEIIPCIYEFVGNFSEGLCDVLNRDENGNTLFGFLDVTGKKQIDFMYEDTVGCFSEGLAGVKFNGKWGFIDKYNNVIIDFHFDDVGYFSEGKALVEFKYKYKDNEKFFINTKGEKLF